MAILIFYSLCVVSLHRIMTHFSLNSIT